MAIAPPRSKMADDASTGTSQSRALLDHNVPRASVNPCKGGGANWKSLQKARKIGNSAENNRGEQRQNRQLFEIASLFPSAANGTVFDNKKPGAVIPPGPLRNSD
jgi:hypothetical protein